MALWAEASTSGGPDLSPLAQYGAIGVICIALIWFSFRSYRREADRADRLEAEVARLNGVLVEQAKSTTETTASMREVITYLQGHVQTERRRT